MQEATGEIMEIFSSIQGEGLLVGEPQLFIRFYGCPRHCRYCDTPASKGPVENCRIEQTPGQGDWIERPNPVSVIQLTDLVRERLIRRSLYHSLVLTGGEPLLHTSYLDAFLPAIRTEIPLFLETSGFLYQELEVLLPHIDMISMDVKLPSVTGEATDWDAHRSFLEIGREKINVIKAVLSPTVAQEDLESLVDIVAGTDASLPVVLQPVHGTEGDPAWAGRLFDVLDFCRKRLASVRVIPQMHKMLKIL
jgi:7-carboxy-7-deazaguanine synthase